jgi:hypothetical protein
MLATLFGVVSPWGIGTWVMHILVGGKSLMGRSRSRSPRKSGLPPNPEHRCGWETLDRVTGERRPCHGFALPLKSMLRLWREGKVTGTLLTFTRQDRRPLCHAHFVRVHGKDGQNKVTRRKTWAGRGNIDFANRAPKCEMLNRFGTRCGRAAMRIAKAGALGLPLRVCHLHASIIVARQEGERWEPAFRLYATTGRCRARCKRRHLDRCRNPCVRGSTVCRSHGAKGGGGKRCKYKGPNMERCYRWAMLNSSYCPDHGVSTTEGGKGVIVDVGCQTYPHTRSLDEFVRGDAFAFSKDRPRGHAHQVSAHPREVVTSKSGRKYRRRVDREKWPLEGLSAPQFMPVRQPIVRRAPLEMRRDPGAK